MRLLLSQAAEVRLGRQRAPQYEVGDHQVRYLRSANVVDGRLDLSDVKSMNFTPAEQAIFAVEPGDVLMTEGSGSAETVGTSAVWQDQLPPPVCFQNTLLRLRPRTGVTDGRYLAWWARHAHGSGQIAAVSSGANIQHLGSDGLKRLQIDVPPLVDQRRIADFLDDRVARIDRIIAARQSQLESNREHLRSVVEKVFDGHVERVRASRVMRVLPGFAFPSDEFSHDDGDVPLLRGINVGVGSLRWDDIVYWPHERLSEVQGFLLSEGDVVLGMDRPWIGGGLRIAQLDRSDGRPLLLQRVAKLSSDGYLSPRFIFWAYQSEQFRQQVESDLTGLSVPHLSGDQILSYQIPALSRSDQRWATDRLDAAQSAVSSASQLLVRSIALLAEYKQSLITAAVTGEFDVTTAGSGIPV